MGAGRKWVKGQSGNPKGRVPGVPNKVTGAFKTAVLEAFHGLGGAKGLEDWGRKNPALFYQIAARLIPHEVEHSGEIRMPTVIDELHRD